MQAILDYLVSLGELIGTLVEFVIDLVRDLIWMISMLGQILQLLPAYLSWIPAGVAGLILAAYAIVVVLRVLGRD